MSISFDQRDYPARERQFADWRMAVGDFRGSYGYGRPAYKPDPDAKYRFQPDIVPPLPPGNSNRRGLTKSESRSAPGVGPASLPQPGPLSYPALRPRMVAAAMRASKMKATMEVGDAVHVKPLGVDATIREVTPLWKLGRREPVYLYDCGLERPFAEVELLLLPGRPEKRER